MTLRPWKWTRAQGSFVRGSLVAQATTPYFEGDV